MDDDRGRMFLAKADVAVPDATLRGLGTARDEELGIDARLLGAARRALDLPAAARCERYVADSTFHRLYAVDDAAGARTLMRVAAFAGEPWMGLMALEAGLGEALRARALPVPSCRFAHVGEGASRRGVQRIEWIEGEAASGRDHEEAITVARLEAVARLLARVHAIRGEGYGPLVSHAPLRAARPTWAEHLVARLEPHVSACLAAGAISGDEARRIETLFGEAAGIECPPALLHGDPGGHNFIVRDGAVAGAIDWEDSLLGDPLFDLASMCTFQPPRRHGAIATAYGASLASGSSEARRFWLYFLRIALAKTVHRQRFGYADAPGRPPAASRIQLALGHLAAASRA